MSEFVLPLTAGLLCIGLAVIAVGGVIVLLVVTRNRKQQQGAVCPDWPAVPGRVIAARVEESVRTRVDDDAFFSPIVEFEYTVAGRVFTGRQALGRPSNLEALAKRALAHYPPGTQVQVNFNPEKPEEARLLLK